MSRPYLTAHQVAELLQLNVETVYALITRDGLPATRVGRRWRFDESSVRAWFHERCNETQIAGDASTACCLPCERSDRRTGPVHSMEESVNGAERHA